MVGKLSSLIRAKRSRAGAAIPHTSHNKPSRKQQNSQLSTTYRDDASDDDSDLELEACDAYNALLTVMEHGKASPASAPRPPKRAKPIDKETIQTKPADIVAAGDIPINATPSAEDGEETETPSILLVHEGLKCEEHLNHELTAAQAAALQSGRVSYQSCEVSGVHKEAWPAATWQVSGCSGLPPAPTNLEGYGIKERLAARWRDVHQEEASTSNTNDTAATSSNGKNSNKGDFVSEQQRSFFGACSSYRDVLLPQHSYPTSLEAADPLVDAYLLHILNHVAVAADRIKRNNQRIKAQEEAAAAAAAAAGQGGGDAAPTPPPRDQGFTRPKVLLLLPQRNFAFQRVRRLVKLAMKETRADSVQGKEKFVEQFGEMEEELPEEMAQRKASRPAEYRALFSGSLDDHFLLGIKITRGAIRLFSDEYDSDVLVASPLALVKKLADGAVEGAADFLSSIEVLVVERADVLAMQNWQHVQTVLSALNQMPTQQHGTDMMRVRESLLSGYACHYRQTLLLSSVLTADINSLSSSCQNHSGCMRLQPNPPGVLSLVIHQVQQLYERYQAHSISEASNERFQYFKNTLWPRIKNAATPGLLLFVPHYFDYIRLRNFLRSEDASFVGLCEYTSTSARSRARTHFFHGRRRILLYTERAHFYNRLHIRGIKDLLWYSLPMHPHFYTELLNMMEENPNMTTTHGSVTALFSRYDSLELGRIVGASRSRKMIKSEAPTFMFC